MTQVCHYCGAELEAAKFELTHHAGDGKIEQRLCSENCLVALAVGSPTIGGKP